MSESSSRKDLAAESVVHRSFNAFFWMLSGTGVQAALRLASVVFLARLLDPDDFGVMAAALVVMGLGALLAQLGLGPALIQRSDLEPIHVRTASTVAVTLGLLLGGVVALGAPLIADFFRMPELTPVLRLLAFTFPLAGASAVADALMRRELHFRTLATIETISFGVGYVALSVVLALLGFGVWSLVIAHLVQTLIKTTALLVFQPHPKRPVVDSRALKELMTYGGGFTLARLFNYIALRGDYVVAGRWLGAASLGLYSRAYQLLVFPVNLFASALDRVLFPFMALVQEEPDRIRSAYRRGNAAVALVFFPLSAFAIVLAPEIVVVALGSQWLDVIRPFQILAAGMVFRAGYKVSDSLARATGAVYRRAWRQGVYAVVVVAGAWLGQHYWGLNGLAAGVLVAILANYLLMNQLSLSLTSSSWASFFVSHAPAVALGLLTLLESLLVTVVLRELGAGPLGILFAATAVVGGTQILLAWRTPAVFGPEGRWLISAAVDRMSGYRSRSRSISRSAPPDQSADADAEDAGLRESDAGNRKDESRGERE